MHQPLRLGRHAPAPAHPFKEDKDNPTGIKGRQGKDIEYSLAGENLALAPTVETAHKGLMNSKGHRENILDEDYRQMGIGVIDNGVYGKMFVQVFTD